MGKSLLKLSDLSEKEIYQILQSAQKYADGQQIKFKDKAVANLFFEPSTRTHYSFIVAEQKLKCEILDFSPITSSLAKGETFYDTVKTFTKFGVDALVIRSRENAWYKQLDKINVPIINAGDGTCDHPTQSLLDLLTIQQEFKKIKGLIILIVGDVLHSRVAHSNIAVMQRLGMKVLLSAPKEFQDPAYSYVNFDEGIKQANIINVLRIQTERFTKKMRVSINEYRQRFGLNAKRVNNMNPKAIIIHPAPVNRNVEIDDDVVECKHSRIFKQIENGVFVRMAILERAFKK